MKTNASSASALVIWASSIAIYFGPTTLPLTLAFVMPSHNVANWARPHRTLPLHDETIHSSERLHEQFTNSRVSRTTDLGSKKRPADPTPRENGSTLRWLVEANAGVSSLLLAATLLLLPMPADAGFGPSGAATTTPAPVYKVDVNDLSVKKLKQLIGSSLDENGLNDFQSQLDALIDNISKSLSSQSTDTREDGEMTTEDQEQQLLLETTRAGDQKRLETAQDFQAQIERREKLLDKLEAQPWWFNYLAAFIGSVASTATMHPVDTIKTRLQAQKSTDQTDDEDREGVFTNLYEGLTGNILKEGPPFALYLGVYESVKSSLLRGALAPIWAGLWGVSAPVASAVSGGDPAYLLSIYLTSGAAGELLGSTVRAPAEVVKNMVQTQAASTATEAFQLALGSPQSRQNVFRAWSSSLLRDVPFGSMQLALFELIKAYIFNSPDIDIDTSTLQSEAVIGTVSGAIGSFLTNPSDVITTRIITQSVGEDEKPLGAFDMGRLIFEEGGLGAFFAGWQARVLYWGPAISIFLTCYCSVRQLGVMVDLFG